MTTGMMIRNDFFHGNHKKHLLGRDLYQYLIDKKIVTVKSIRNDLIEFYTDGLLVNTKYKCLRSWDKGTLVKKGDIPVENILIKHGYLIETILGLAWSEWEDDFSFLGKNRFSRHRKELGNMLKNIAKEHQQ